MTVPDRPKIYHIVHMDRLASIIADGFLWCDAEVVRRSTPGSVIGMTGIKQRRLALGLESHPGLRVGDCVPFYFCPRSIMLYLIFRGNHGELGYRGGQEPVVHLVADLRDAVSWADANQRRWAFTLSNAGSRYFEDRCDLERLYEIDWNAVESRQWADPSVKEGKQAEFLMEHCFPWNLIESIGVHSADVQRYAASASRYSSHRPRVRMEPDWYY
jgi:hypothetical protein